MAFAEANGQGLYHEVHGVGEPLILVMGLGADHLSWTMQVPAFSHRFRTIVFDNRDVGQSSYADGPYEVSDMAADTLALADVLELDSFHLLGTSLGGAIAQEVALAAPERVRTLTLATTWGGAGSWARENARMWGAQALSFSREEAVDQMLLLCMSEAFFENGQAVAVARSMLLANPHPQDPEAFVRQLEAGSRHDTRDRLGGLSMPVHVIGAGHDILVPVWKSKELAELIPGAKLTVIEGAAHGVNVERAEEFNAAVLEFLAAH